MPEEIAGTTVQRAFVQAWTEAKNPPLDKENPHFHARFASLEATLKAIRDACNPQGIAYVQRLTRCEDGYELRSSVMDADGACIALSSFPVAVPADPQKFGATMTYIKRQQAQADWGIVGEEDDDAESISGTNAGADIMGRCPECGTVYIFADEAQLDGYRCEQCGGRFERC